MLFHGTDAAGKMRAFGRIFGTLSAGLPAAFSECCNGSSRFPTMKGTPCP
jgi:hypothetical protein